MSEKREIAGGGIIVSLAIAGALHVDPVGSLASVARTDGPPVPATINQDVVELSDIGTFSTGVDIVHRFANPNASFGTSWQSARAFGELRALHRRLDLDTSTTFAGTRSIGPSS